MAASAKEIFEEAEFVAQIYAGHNPNRTWWMWSKNARDDFWSIAQDGMDIPRSEQTACPLEYLGDAPIGDDISEE